MKRSRLFAPLVVLIAMFIGAGSVLAVLQANEMAEQMSMASDKGENRAAMCDACNGDNDVQGMMNCFLLCHHSTMATLTIPAVVGSVRRASYSKRPDMPVDAFADAIDPSPPKPIVLI